jgi:hypothetical protein
MTFVTEVCPTFLLNVMTHRRGSRVVDCVTRGENPRRPRGAIARLVDVPFAGNCALGSLLTWRRKAWFLIAENYRCVECGRSRTCGKPI